MAASRARTSALALALAAAWIVLFRDALVGLVASAPRNSTLVDLLLAGGLVALLLRHLVRVEVRPVLRATPLAIASATAVAHLVNLATAQIDLASGVMMVLGAWGLLGLYVSPRRWAQALPLLLAGLCALPVGPALDLYVGFPLRLATAELTQGLLAPLFPGELATQTIILLDGGAAGVQIDLPCSGVRSLWSGAVFWAAATWIERVRIGWSWCARGVAFVAILVATNLARVLALVVLHAFAPPVASTLLHVPLGLVAFVAACTLGWLLLRGLPKSTIADDDASRAHARPAPIGALVAALLVLAVIPTPRGERSEPATPTIAGDWAHPVALGDGERRLFGSRGAAAVGKWDVALGDLRAQLLLVKSRSWRAQHRPDVCHAASGRRIDDNRTVMIDPQFPVRVLRLVAADTEAWGVYWFQSATAITDDHDARVWSALDGDAESWVMVSLVIEGALPVTDPAVLALLHKTRHEADLLVRSTTKEP